MLDVLFIVSLIRTVTQALEEACQPVIPAENWANKELINKDRLNGISEKEFNKNLANGKYKLIKAYPEPHKDPVSGKIIIENSLLYKEDVRKYGPVQAQKWVAQGKYNLTPEELRKEEERIKKNFERLYKMHK